MVYARSPHLQAAKKAIFGSGFYRESLSLFQRLQEHTESVASKTGLETVWIADEKQEGPTFGERYTNAFKKLFDLGYDQVISVGNDIPGLTADLILKAAVSLETHGAVLGPSLDGGDYLIALRRENFDAQSFDSLPWNSPLLHQSLKKSIGESSLICTLDVLTDIDDMASLVGFSTENRHTELGRYVRYLLKKTTLICQAVQLVAVAFIPVKSTQLRAPPLS